MIEVFKTTIKSADEARQMTGLLLQHHPNCKINIDYEDCDHVLRIEGEFEIADVTQLIVSNQFSCEPLQ